MGKTYNWLSQNSKLKKSGIYNWGIPAIKTCPQAGICKIGCYADMGAYKFNNVARVFKQRLELSKRPEFISIMHQEIRRRKVTKLRIHDSGDFYNEEYAGKWFHIMKLNPDVKFYAYTKMVDMFKNKLKDAIPENFTIIFSYGGRQDDMIDPAVDRHSVVFETLGQLQDNGYADAAEYDTVALEDNPKIGLIYHGNKSFENTEWVGQWEAVINASIKS